MASSSRNAEVFTLVERFDIEMAKKLALPNNKIVDRVTARKIQQMLDKYPDGSYRVKYVKDRAFGRLTIKSPHSYLTCARQPREVRRALANGMYVDLDIAKCHPSFIKQYADRYNIPCPGLVAYIEFTDELREELVNAWGVNEDEAKEAFNSSSFGHGLSNLRQKLNVPEDATTPEGLALFREDVKVVANHMWKNPELASLRAFVKKLGVERGNDTNEKMKVMSHWAQDLERRSVVPMIQYLLDEGYEVGAYVFDGFVVYVGEDKDCVTDGLLNELEAIALQETGYRCELVEKSMEIPSAVEEELESIDAGDGITDDLSAARKIYAILDGDNTMRITCHGFTMYDATIGMWIVDDDMAAVRRHVARMASELDGGDKKNYGGNASKTSAALAKLRDIVNVDMDFMENTVDTSIGKLLFKNGILDMETGELGPFDPKVVFFNRIDRDYVPGSVTSDVKDWINAKLFKDPFTSEQIDEGVDEYVKIMYARSIFGRYRDRDSWFVLGDTSSAKGTHTDALKAAFGGFVSTMNATSLVAPKFAGDGAKALSFLGGGTGYKRAIFVNEMDPGMEMSGSLFKQVVSGGDQLTVRQNYTNEAPLTCRFHMILFGNDKPNFKPMDDAIADRIHGVVEFMVRFCNDVDGRNPEYFKAKDPSIKDRFHDPKVRDAIVMILVEAYRKYMERGHVVPPSVAKSKEEWFVVDTIDSRLDRLVEFTGDDADYVITAQVQEAMKANDISTNKVGRMLKKRGGVKGVLRIGNETHKGWRRLRMKDAASMP